jgi:hypothetical protein
MADAERDAGGPVAIARGILAIVVAWWTIRLASGAASWCFVDFANLAFHEAGHVFLRPFGQTIHYLGGTVFQLAIPAILAGYFLLRRDEPFGAAFCAWWLGESLVNVARYMADARDWSMPLVGGGDHDWNELFYRFGVLDEPSVTAISSTTHGLGVVIMVLGLLWLGFFLLPGWLRQAVTERLPRWGT